jgi:hypothetical protein
MNTFNNFSPLAFREKSMKATYKKWYAYGKEFALPFSTTELPPFQFTVASLPTFDPTTVEVFLVDEATGTRVATGIKIKVDTMDEHNSVLYVSPGSNVYAKSIEPGVYRAEFAIPEGETYVSTPICVTDGIETNTNFVKLEYWNDEKLAYPNGFVTTGTDNDFKFQMYIPTTFFKPKYEFEEEITKRAGYKFLELQTCNKVFGFNFLAPEYICDALRLVRLSDYIRFTHDGEYYNALNFEYNPDWQDNGYLAAIECQFETDTIIQKLPSFNRRDRESFYNALLADIDTPILFSPDVVGLYYREYKQGEPTIKGKLIRELSPIDLIDENTTIAVDMGAGEARKFNLYRMLEGYISKNHEDVTEFLLSLRGGVNIGTQNTSGEYPASVDRYGNANVKDIHGNDATLNKVTGKDATFKTAETGFLTVNKTSATIDGMGNANVNDLTARGDSMLRSDVYTGSKNGSHTGKITEEGQLQYLSAIIYEFLSSETFVPGFLGEGFKIWLENGNWNIECDNLTVRQTMNIFELLIQKIRSVNGAIVVSQSNGKVTSVEDTGTQYKITFGEEFPTFQEGDLIRCQSWSKNNLKFYWVEVKTAADGYVLCDKSEFNNVVPAVGDEVVQMGNTKNAERQALIYITAQESGKPYIEILNGVKTKSLTGTDRTRLGDLSNIVDPDFTGEAAVKGTGFYSTNAFLKGIFVLRNGKRVEDEIKIAKDAADQAAQDAANAAQSAQEAKNRLNKWADDGFISPTEKPALIDEGKRIKAEYLQIKANADKYGVLVTEYTEAYNNYLNELRYHSAATPEDIAVRPELAQTQTIYYDKRNGALNAIADAAKSYVDNADKQLKEYLDTEITAVPGKIELAVRSLKVADVNLLKGAYKELKNADYGFGAYSYDVPFVNGKEYMLTVCYTLSANNTYIEAYANGGSNFIANFDTKGDKVVESKKVTMVGYKPGEGLWFFQFPNGTYGSKVHWAVLTDGNLGVTSWIPAASERVAGIKNLCSFKRIVDAGFTYASRYDDDGTILMLPSVLHKESFVANKDMFGLTYDSQKRYYVFIDHFVPSATIPNGTRSISLRIVYTDGTSEAMSVFNDSIENNFILTSKAIRYILGSYDTSIPTYLRIGVFETDIPVSWSPAPEDQLYQSVKYTDTQILAVDGKISLSVATELNKRVIGGANLILKSGTCVTGVNRSAYFDMSQYFRDLRGKKVTISFDYEYSNLELGGNNRIGLEEQISKDGTSEYYYVGAFKYFNSLSPKAEKGRFVNTITIPEDIVNSQNKGINLIIQVGNSTNMKVCNPQIEIGDTATGWKPAPEDGVIESKEYTNSQISVVEGKIELSVKTQLEKSTIGGENLLDGSKNYWFNESDYGSNVTLLRDGDAGATLVKGKGLFNSYKKWMPVNKSEIRNGVEYTLGIDINVQGNYYHNGSFWVNIRRYEGSNVIILANEYVYIENKPNWVRYYVTFKTPDSGNINDLLFLCGFSGENKTDNPGVSYYYRNINLTEGGIGTSWSPSANDTYNKSVEYTVSQIDIVEGKIESKVEKTVYQSGLSRAEAIARYVSTGRMLPEHSDVTFKTGLNGLKSYNNYPSEGVKLHRTSGSTIPNGSGYMAVITCRESLGTLPGAGGFYFGNISRANAVFLYKIVAMIPGGKTIEFATNPIGDGSVNEWLTSQKGTGKWEEYYCLVKCGDKGAFERTGYFHIIEPGTFEWYLAYATCYDIYGDNSQITKTDYQTKITQLDQSISLKASQTDLTATTERVRLAEIKLDSTSIKLGVVEGKADDAQSTASSANTAAGNAQKTANTANSTADYAKKTADATANGLTFTGIYIAQKKIILASDNVVFQNNAGQQTAAINANGRLTANAIEAGEVVASGFAAQRITTGNLTVTNGAVIAGMTISDGVLRGSNVELTNGAKIGSFIISNGIFSAQGVPAGMQMSLGSNLSTFDSSGVKIDHNSGGYALTTSGNGRVYLKGSSFWAECQDYEFIGATSWKAPGVFYAATILSNGNIGRTWGNPDFHITRVDHTATGTYTIHMSGNVGAVFPTLTCYDLTKWAYPVISLLSENSISYKMVDVSRQLVNCGVCIHFCGMV